MTRLIYREIRNATLIADEHDLRNLPGDPRGSVTSVRDRRPGDPPTTDRIEHSQFGTPVEPCLPGLYRSAQLLMKAPTVLLSMAEARSLLDQFRETCEFRRWQLEAVAIMTNHFHIVIAADEAIASPKILTDLKAYGSRRLNKYFGE
jgi:hypothetical protein